MKSSVPLRFDGQVAIVTGAGGGLGRSFALALAARGASVLVNDYGGDTSGQGGGSAMAERVVAEITAAGGRALADSTPVGNADAARGIVRAAEAAFGPVDILVNNAGIALPGLLDAASDAGVAAMFSTNLVGPLHLMRAAWPSMRERGHGRVLNVSSNAAMGIGANALYGASKAGLIGLTLDAAAEGRPHGILVNALMPVAFTRMIEQIPDPDFVAWFRRHFGAEKVAAAMLHFLTRASEVTGHVISSGGGRLARIAFASSAGVARPGLVPEDVPSLLERAFDLRDARTLLSQPDEMALYAQCFEWAGQGEGPALSHDAVAHSGPGEHR